MPEQVVDNARERASREREEKLKELARQFQCALIDDLCQKYPNLDRASMEPYFSTRMVGNQDFVNGLWRFGLHRALFDFSGTFAGVMRAYEQSVVAPEQDSPMARLRANHNQSLETATTGVTPYEQVYPILPDTDLIMLRADFLIYCANSGEVPSLEVLYERAYDGLNGYVTNLRSGSIQDEYALREGRGVDINELSRRRVLQEWFACVDAYGKEWIAFLLDEENDQAFQGAIAELLNYEHLPEISPQKNITLNPSKPKLQVVKW